MGRTTPHSGPILPGASASGFHAGVAVASAYLYERDHSQTGFVQVESKDVNDTLLPAP
jgi:hypothetical protein